MEEQLDKILDFRGNIKGPKILPAPPCVVLRIIIVEGVLNNFNMTSAIGIRKPHLGILLVWIDDTFIHNGRVQEITQEGVDKVSIP